MKDKGSEQTNSHSRIVVVVVSLTHKESTLIVNRLSNGVEVNFLCVGLRCAYGHLSAKGLKSQRTYIVIGSEHRLLHNDFYI